MISDTVPWFDYEGVGYRMIVDTVSGLLMRVLDIE